MKLPGTVVKHGKFWVIDVPSIAVSTQSFKKSEVLFYITDALDLMVPGLGSEAEWTSRDTFTVSAKNNGLFKSFILQRVRLGAGLTQGELAALVGQKSHATISAYESGARHPSLDSLMKYLNKMNYDVELTISNLEAR